MYYDVDMFTRRCENTAEHIEIQPLGTRMDGPRFAHEYNDVCDMCNNVFSRFRLFISLFFSIRRYLKREKTIEQLLVTWCRSVDFRYFDDNFVGDAKNALFRSPVHSLKTKAQKHIVSEIIANSNKHQIQVSTMS